MPVAPRPARSLSTLTLVTLLAGCSSADPGPEETVGDARFHATIRRTAHGVAHIAADDPASAAFGQAYAFAEDHACILADQILKVRSERARFLGPGAGDRHIRSDIGYLALGVYADAEAMLAAQPDDVRAIIEGYVAGYNAFIEDKGVASIPGYCRGAEWVRPITEVDLAAYYVSLGLVASGVQLVDYIADAQPPGAGLTLPGRPAKDMRAAADSGIGSNGWAIGADKSEGGRGMVVANPHFPWLGELKLWESQVTVPGDVNVYGASLIGVPGALIGFNEDVAWTHTFSVEGKRFTLYTLDLVPGEPTKYYYDGAVREMTPQEYTIQVKGDDGSLSEYKRTLWFTHYGPMLNVNDFGWSEEIAITYRDANHAKYGLIEQWHRMNRAKSMAEFQQAYVDVDGIPWVHTMAADREGNVFYIDGASTPKVSQATVDAWQKSLDDGELVPLLLWDQADVIVLDGSTSANEWITDPATGKATVPITEVPQLAGRRDFVMNANDSHWLANPAQPLVGYSRLHGGDREPQSLRTRMNLTMLTEVSPGGASGADGRFNLEELKGAILGNRSMSADLLRAAVAERCKGAPAQMIDGEAYELGAACGLLAGWDGLYDLESVGAIVWREMMGSFNGEHTKDAGPLFQVGFDPDAPITTPNTLKPPPASGTDQVLFKLAQAVKNLGEAGIALDTPLGEVQYAERGGERIPLHGGQAADGVANQVFYGSLSTALEPEPSRGDPVNPVTDLAPGGYLVTYGSSFIMTMEFTEEGPRGEAILTYGQSDDEASPFYNDQLWRFSNKEWRPILFTEEAIAGDPELKEYEVHGG
ncbi:MAG: penicillin acylase family protein [Myxococcales bacterium]|nr:penicillin acylase family protein [Myxococcales bacterium]